MQLSKSIVFSRKLNQLKVTSRWLFISMLCERGEKDIEFQFPYTRIRQVTGLSRPTIRQCIRELENADLITYSQGGLEQNPSRYRINQSWLDFATDHGTEIGVDIHFLENKRTIVAWKAIRWKVMERDGYKCTKCPNTTSLVVHHLTYERYGHELLEDLVTLCTDCHRKEPTIYDTSRQ